MTQILANIPLWVYPLFIALTLIGLRGLRDRLVPLWLLYALPLLGGLSLIRAGSLGGVAVIMLLLGWGVGLGFGLRLQPRWTIRRTDSRVELRGEAITLITLLGLFAANFGAGMMLGMAPSTATGAGFGMGWGLLAGGLSGTLAGRAISIARTRPA